MFDYDAMIRDGFIDPQELWLALDSFWRTTTGPRTNSFVHYLQYADTVELFNNVATGNNFLLAQDPRTLLPYVQLPWIPMVIYRDLLFEESAIRYGDAYVYGGPIVYGQAGPTTRWVHPVDPGLVGIGGLADGVVNTTAWFDDSTVALNVTRQQLEFTDDPFTIVTPKIAAATGKEYIVLWIRNAQLDYNVPKDTWGWVIRYDGLNTPEYSRSMDPLWQLVIQGPQIGTWETGLNIGVGLPVAERTGTVRGIVNDGFNDIVLTDADGYPFPQALTPAVIPGDTVIRGTPLTTAIHVWEYDAILAAPITDIPGLALMIPLSTGVAAELVFANILGAWTFDAFRPSPWRFTISGTPADVEQFWVDVDTYATANSINLQALFGLPAPVNPMMLVIEQLLKNNVVIASLQLADIQVPNPAAFPDRARFLLPPGALIILQQGVGSVADVLDLGVSASETIGYGYHVVPPTEIISVSATDLILSDYTPGVFLS